MSLSVTKTLYFLLFLHHHVSLNKFKLLFFSINFKTLLWAERLKRSGIQVNSHPGYRAYSLQVWLTFNTCINVVELHTCERFLSSHFFSYFLIQIVLDLKVNMLKQLPYRVFSLNFFRPLRFRRGRSQMGGPYQKLSAKAKTSPLS